jgi:tRNA threonylcarbamoyl adenosine modification protein (Sua5/YciO/YrdC/YwlC family)
VSETIPITDFERARDRTVEVLAAGGAAVVPCDTVYALIGDAFSRPATRRLLRLRGGGRQAPLPVLIRSPRQVIGLVDDVPEAAERLMASYWPGPLTLVFPAAEGLGWDLGESAGTVALRMPTSDLVLAVIAKVGPLAATGATPAGSGEDSVEAAQRRFGERVSVYVDAGPPGQAGGGVAQGVSARSTIVDVSRGHAVVLRPGAIPAEHVRQVADGTLGWGQRAPAHGSTVLEQEPAGAVEGRGVEG